MTDGVPITMVPAPAEAECERTTDGPWTEPVAALTSVAFVVGALIIVLSARPARGR